MRRFPGLYATLAFVIVAMLSVGCSSRGSRAPKNVGETKVVEKTPKNRPGWVGVPYKEKGPYIYFGGEAGPVRDRSLGLRQAKADAMQNLLESIRVRARSEFSEAVRGVNTPEGSVGRYVDDLVVWTTDNLDVAGAIPVEEYSERVRTRTYDGYDYTFQCFVWLRLPEEEYRAARAAALDKARAEAVDEEARELAVEAKEKLEAS